MTAVCEFDTGSALGNVRVCRLPATHTVRDGEVGGTRGRFCREHARTARYVMFGYRSDARYALVTVEAFAARVTS